MKRTIAGLVSILLMIFTFMLAGCSGGESAPPPTTVPAAPTGLNATPADSQVTISWTAVAGATSYNLYHSTTAGVTTTTGTKITGVTSPYVQTGLTNGTTYFYILTAVNSIGESAPSNEVSATPSAVITPPTIPAAPTGVTAVGGTNQVTVTWNTVTGATSYNIYYSTTTGVTTANGTKLAGVASPDVVTGLAVSTTYFFIVTAVNSAGESVASSQVSATTNAAAPVVPAAPTGVSATAGQVNSVPLTWTAVSGATSYNVYRGTATGVTIGNGTKMSGIATTTFTDTNSKAGLNANTAYFYIVTAVNATGESAASSEVNATTSATDGVALYSTNCSGCHGALLTSSKRGASATTIQNAINNNTGGMGTTSLKALTSTQVAAIATVLGF